MAPLKWPNRWQLEAIDAARPYVDTDERLHILAGDPAASLSGTVMEGHLYRGDDNTIMVLHDRSARPDVHPWRLLLGPILTIKLLRPRRRAIELFRHPEWTR
jgi:hypothetical protein